MVEQQDLPALPVLCSSPWGFQKPIPEAEVQQLLPSHHEEAGIGISVRKFLTPSLTFPQNLPAEAKF